MDRVWETRPSRKLVGTKASGARSKDLNDCKPGVKVASQPSVLNVKQKKRFSWYVQERTRTAFEAKIKEKIVLLKQPANDLYLVCTYMNRLPTSNKTKNLMLGDQGLFDYSRLIKQAGIGL